MSRVAHPKLRAAVLKAAEDVFAERGLEDADVDEIAARAGAPAGAFDVFFESKEAALGEIVEAWIARCASFFEGPNEYPDASSDPDGLLDFCIERDAALYRFLWDTRVTLRLVQRWGAAAHELARLGFRDEMQRRNRAWLEQWRAEGFVRPETDLELAAAMMSGAYEELTKKMLRAERRPPIERWIEVAREAFVRAFGTPELVAAADRRAQRPTLDRYAADGDAAPSR